MEDEDYIAILDEFQSACERGDLEKAQEYADKWHFEDYISRLRIQKIFFWICYRGELDLAQWFADRFKLITDDIRPQDEDNIGTFQGVCETKYLDVLKWLDKYFILTNEDARANDNYTLSVACNDEHLESAHWIADRFEFTVIDIRMNNCEILHNACEMGGEGGQWIVDRFDLTPEDAGKWAEYLNFDPDRNRPYEEELGPKYAGK